MITSKNTNEASSIVSEGKDINFLTQKIKQDAKSVINGETHIKRLSPTKEQGRIVSGQRNVEATLIAERSKGTGNQAEQRASKESALEDYAKKEGIWHDYVNAPQEDTLGDELDRGSEAKLYHKGDG